MTVSATTTVSIEWLDTLLRQAGLPPATGFAQLGGGTYNTVLRVATNGGSSGGDETGGGEVVVKVPPPLSVPQMSYEFGITGTEAEFYRLAADRGITSVPRTLYHGHVDGAEALVLSVCPGEPWPTLSEQLDRDHRFALRHAVGRELAALHAISGPGYGYPAVPLLPTWREAFVGMVDTVLRDAARFGVALPRDAATISRIVDRVSPVLDEVRTPALVHFDLWDGNILVDTSQDSPRLGGLIDAERAFWGDPLAELVSLWLLGDVDPDDGLLAGYREAGGELDLDASARTRLALYRIYLYLIMWVEVVPRHFDAGRVAWLEHNVVAPTVALLDALARDH